MYKQTIIPDKNNHSIDLPEEFYGKKVDVIIVEVDEGNISLPPTLPEGKKVPLDQLFEMFGADPDFPSIEEIRSKVWPSKW